MLVNINRYWKFNYLPMTKPISVGISIDRLIDFGIYHINIVITFDNFTVLQRHCSVFIDIDKFLFKFYYFYLRK